MDERAGSRFEEFKKLQTTNCYCSACGRELRYRSFNSHPCFLRAVAIHGRYCARNFVHRLSTPPKSRKGCTSHSVNMKRLGRVNRVEERVPSPAIPPSPNRLTPRKRSRSPSPPSTLNQKRPRLEEPNFEIASVIDLQRWQMISQLIGVIEMWLPYRRLLEKHGIALLLFPPLLNVVVDKANKARGRVSASSQRNCAARVNYVAMALCRELNVCKRLRTPLTDWYESWRQKLEREAREARNVHRQAHAIAEQNLPSSVQRATSVEVALWQARCLWKRFLVVSMKAVTVLTELESLQRELQHRSPTRRDAEFFQPRLGALVAFLGGGVLRPGSVSGLFMSNEADGHTVEMVKPRTASVHEMGYEGPLTLALLYAPSQCYVLHLLAFKNMASRLELQQSIGGVRYVLCRPVSDLLTFFVGNLRPLLEPKEDHPFAFVKVVGEGRGLWFDAQRNGFGRYCGQPNGLSIGSSIRTLRHVVTTDAVRQQWTHEDRADLCEVNLHTLVVANEHYVNPQVAEEAQVSLRFVVQGNFMRGLGKMYRLFTEQFRRCFRVPVNYLEIAYPSEPW